MDENQLREQIITHFFKVFKDNEGNIFGAFKIGTTNITDNLINSNTTFTLKETETNISFSFLVYVDKKGKNSLQFEHVSEKVGICRTKFNKLIVIKNGKLKIEIGQGNFNGFEEDKEEIEKKIKILEDKLSYTSELKIYDEAFTSVKETPIEEILKKLFAEYYFRYRLRNILTRNSEIRKIPPKNQKPINPSNENSKLEKNMKLQLNTILYGPPGTGKTYNTINNALKIVYGDNLNGKQEQELEKLKEERKKAPNSGKRDVTERDAIQSLFKKLLKSKENENNYQIVFTTFHQNYTYEDFMIGIKPNIKETDKGLSFVPHEGVFFKIAQKAKENYELCIREKVEQGFNEIYLSFLNVINNEIKNNKNSELLKITNKHITLIDLKNGTFGYAQEGGSKISIQKEYVEKLYNKYGLKEITEDELLGILENLRDKGNAGRLKNLYNYFVQNVRNVDFAKTDIKNYVLIIDEINRANISKVFGELITLLEDDKRIGADNELKVTLPNGEEFGVPPNLYVIGTMNTADKSIALIDIALRRRFHFEGMYPKPELITTDYNDKSIEGSVTKEIEKETTKSSEPTEPTEKAKFLIALNAAIYEKKKSADWLVGHAYFMKDETLDVIIKNKIIPLLLEYFGNKTDEVASILTKANHPYRFDTKKVTWSEEPTQKTDETQKPAQNG